MTQADLTRQRLARAALELFTTRGYHPTTTPLIAKKAGVAEGTIYRHFTNKQHLLNEVFRGAARWAQQTVTDVSAAPGTPAERLATVARAMLDAASRDPSLLRILLLVPLADLLDERSRAAERAFRATLEAVIAQGKAEGLVRPGGVEVWSGVWLAIVGLAVARVADKTWRLEDASVGVVIDAAWRAIAS